MRILLDNCVPWRLASAIEGHPVTSVIDIGRAGLSDSELPDRMTGQYEVLVTVDRGIRHQQRLHDRSFAVVLLRARTNRLTDLLPLIPALLEALGQAKAGAFREIGTARS